MNKLQRLPQESSQPVKEATSLFLFLSFIGGWKTTVLCITATNMVWSLDLDVCDPSLFKC